MIFNVAQLLMEPTGANRIYDVDEPVHLPFEGEPAVQLAGTVELTRIPTGLLARALLRGVAPLACGRCLGPAAVPLDLQIEEPFIPTIDPNSGVHVVAPADEEISRIDERQHLDLTDAVRQEAVLAEPMAVLCRPDCAGLCPECGADRNLATCDCPPRPTDPRWSGLSGFAAAGDQPDE